MFLVCESVQIKTWRSQANCVISGGACSPLAQQGTGTHNAWFLGWKTATIVVPGLSCKPLVG